MTALPVSSNPEPARHEDAGGAEASQRNPATKAASGQKSKAGSSAKKAPAGKARPKVKKKTAATLGTAKPD